MGGTTTGDDDDGRVSLAPLDPETALRALLRVKPDERPADDDSDTPPDGPTRP